MEKELVQSIIRLEMERLTLDVFKRLDAMDDICKEEIKKQVKEYVKAELRYDVLRCISEYNKAEQEAAKTDRKG